MTTNQTLGTILPTAAGLRKADAFADRQQQEMESKADALLSSCCKRHEGGEIRYYRSETQYAVMGRSGKVRWFEIRKDGTYAI